jgi:chromosome segregation ATPase
MWNNLKNIASDAIDAAIDIKQHIVEVTANDIEVIDDPDLSKQPNNEDYIDSIVKELYSLKEQLKDLTENYNTEKNQWNAEKHSFADTISILEAAVAEKERENIWEAENYQAQMQDLIKIKNRLQRDYEKATEELISLKSNKNHNKFIAEKLEELNTKIKHLDQQNQELTEEKHEWKQKYENYLKNEEDKISRSFFIQFISTYNRNVYNTQERQDMLESLGNILHLTNEEKNLLGIEIKNKPKVDPIKPQDEEPSLFDKFTTFLSGVNP